MQSKMDVARILARTKCFLVLDEMIKVKINGILFRIKFVEYSHGPLRVCMKEALETFDFQWFI